MNTFAQDKKRGKVGERRAERLLTEVFHVQPIDVSEEEIHQMDDVDFIVNEHKIEVKTDYQKTGNLFYETVSNELRGTKGNMLTTKATILFYMLEKYEVILTVNIDSYREWVNKNDFREVSVYSSNSRGLLVPIETLVKSQLSIGLYNYENEKLTVNEVQNKLREWRM